MPKQQQEAKPKPAKAFRIGYVRATIWLNEKHYSVYFSRSYKSGDEWKDGETFSHGDLLNLAQVAKRAEDFCAAN
jgi:predicted nucleotidyltransferase